MDVPRPPRGQPYVIGALGVLSATALLHLLLAHLFFSALVADASWESGGPKAAVLLVVIGTVVGLFAALYLRTQYSSPDHVTRTIPFLLRLLPPLIAAAVVPAIYDTDLLRTPATAIASVAPVVSSCWASAFVLSVLLKRILHAMAIRARGDRPVGAFRAFDPPTLAGSYARVLAATTFAAVLLVLGAIASRMDLSSVSLGVASTIAAAVGVMVVIAAAAGASLAQSPGRDVVSIAGRLDAVGYSPRQSMDWPVVATSFDEVGELFSKLEDLRTRLAREVSIYEQALEKTREADNSKAEFLGAVSHELRTPLNSVCGFAQLLLEGTPQPLTEPQVEDVRLIRAGGQQLLDLINDILDISMIESGELRLSFSAVDIGGLVREIVEFHQPLVREKGIRMTAEVESDLPAAICDRRRIGQILTNLVSNAIKFTDEGSIMVRATLDLARGDVMLRVIDTGVGIADEDIEGIFEEYRQVGSVKRRKKGTGLGLAIARSIATHHGGALMAESKIGEGSCFILSLPVNPPRRPASIDVTEEAARAVERAKRRTGELPIPGVVG